MRLYQDANQQQEQDGFTIKIAKSNILCGTLAEKYPSG